MTGLARLAEQKRRGERIVMITAYDYPSARIVEAAGVDVVLVGDSAATTVLGYDTTRAVSIDEMLVLTRAVRRGLTTPLLIADLAFGTYEETDEQAVASAARFMEIGCDAVKLEGAGPMLSRVRALVAAGIPVMGHVGLTPQQVRTADGYRAQGRDAASGRAIVDDAVALEGAGATSLVVEAVPPNVTEALVQRVSIPVIGIGAGSATDGQVLVYHDVLGLLDRRPAKFVRAYGAFAAAMSAAVRTYAEEVRAGVYPGPEHTYKMLPDEVERFASLLAVARPPVDPTAE
ncbi:MAG TPA: 3-methyl-2-oxobutanoate hydroxymethyltransferase [Gemmatimonadaceae bacterium]|nr:3-methyl-2-oxobutanoate hydroxymethyltransferase [Gemmatimonadaceae bacterium]